MDDVVNRPPHYTRGELRANKKRVRIHGGKKV